MQRWPSTARASHLNLHSLGDPGVNRAVAVACTDGHPAPRKALGNAGDRVSGCAVDEKRLAIPKASFAVVFHPLVKWRHMGRHHHMLIATQRIREHGTEIVSRLFAQFPEALEEFLSTELFEFRDHVTVGATHLCLFAGSGLAIKPPPMADKRSSPAKPDDFAVPERYKVRVGLAQIPNGIIHLGKRPIEIVVIAEEVEHLASAAGLRDLLEMADQVLGGRNVPGDQHGIVLRGAEVMEKALLGPL